PSAWAVFGRSLWHSPSTLDPSSPPFLSPSPSSSSSSRTHTQMALKSDQVNYVKLNTHLSSPTTPLAHPPAIPFPRPSPCITVCGRPHHPTYALACPFPLTHPPFSRFLGHTCI
ncbi:hypothetical protein BOTBODRAFT_28826, partial [Botryobasidium botryosum FD-172 SS1]